MGDQVRIPPMPGINDSMSRKEMDRMFDEIMSHGEIPAPQDILRKQRESKEKG